MGLTSKAFSDIITFSRSSNATRVGPDGKIAYAPHNLVLRSQEFDNVEWAKNTGVTVTANSAAAPDGTVTADKIVYDGSGSSGSYRLYNNTVPTSVNGVKYTSSIWLRSDTPITVRLTGNGVAGDTLCNVTSTWQRFYSTGTGNGASGLQLLIYSAPSDNTAFTIYAWGAQVSQGSIAGDYTPTTSAAVYGPRFDYDPVTLAAKGLLIEEQRTNLLTYSEDFTNAAWTATAATVSANAATAPDGTSTADILTDNVSSDTHRVYQISTTTAAAYTASVFAKAGTRSWIYIRIQDSGGAGRHVWFNLATGTVGTTETGMTAAIQAAGNGWYRCAATVATAIAGATNQVVVIGMSTGDAVSIYAGGSGTVSLWGAQLEAGAFATSYIPTVASTVTRSADVASVNTLSPWFNAVEGTLFAQFDEAISSSSITNQVFASLNDGTANNEMLLYRSGGGFDARFAILTSGALQADVATSITIAQNTAYKTAGAYKLNDIAASTSGNTPGTDTSATIPTVSALQIGGGRSTTAFSGHLRRLAYYPRRLTNAELQALTA